MHTDEFRDPQELRRLRIAEAVSVFERDYASLPKLEGKAYTSQLAKLEAEKGELEASISDARRTIEGLQRENATLSNEKDRVNEQLRKLRNSRTMRVGKTVTSPVKVRRKFAKNPKGLSREAARLIHALWIELRASLDEKCKTKDKYSIPTKRRDLAQQTVPTSKKVSLRSLSRALKRTCLIVR